MDRVARKKTRFVRVGSVMIGGEAPIVIQSMTNTRTSDISATLDQIDQLTLAGCELVRLAVPDETAAVAISELARRSPVPLIADIHFDSRLACLAIENGASKIRINPGNIGGRDKLVEIIKCAKRFHIPIRIGVNAGSLEREILQKYGEASAAALVDSALGYVAFFEEIGFQDLVVSLKASDVFTTIEACRIFSEKSSYPLHLGVTEAGPLEAGTIKNAVGIGTLLAEGIGDTLRVSLTASPVEEIKVARSILQALNIRLFAPELISCPTCGRCEVDLLSLVKQVESILKKYKTPIKVAVMGCAVNGPGEAREADIGISAGKKQGLIFRHGRVIRTVDFDKLLDALIEELDSTPASSGRDKKGD
jgi:(E)-4-hydroxy-3-methylbut-2-enyl-diphosphate synthase